MSDSEIYAFLQDVLRETFEKDDLLIRPDLTARDVVGWDSFKQVEITLALEEKYGIRIRTRELNNVADVGELVKLVQQKVVAKG